jgi:hypothetical protein
MGYYDQSAVPAFDFFARNFAICDNWFSPLPPDLGQSSLRVSDQRRAIEPLAKMHGWIKAEKIEGNQWNGLGDRLDAAFAQLKADEEKRAAYDLNGLNAS